MMLRLDEIRSQLELLISATPTGILRNVLCDANIQLLLAEDVSRGLSVLTLERWQAAIKEAAEQDGAALKKASE